LPARAVGVTLNSGNFHLAGDGAGGTSIGYLACDVWKAQAARPNMATWRSRNRGTEIASATN
jgi:hypothetical protein